MMPSDFLGPTLEEVQVWLRSSPDSARAGFVLSVEVVNARLGRVLVVEDDPGIATQLVRGLTRAGYETGSVTTGQAALDWPVPDVVLLDLGLPDIDGIEVCRRLRQACDAAIIVVTARGEESDRVLALDEGADDYLIKPFGLQELLARIRAVLRRSRQPAGQVLQHGALTVDLRTHKVSVSGQQIAVTPKEFAILECLASDPGRVVSRQEIARAGLGRALVRPDQGARRAHGRPAPQAGRPRHHRDGVRARVPPGRPGRNRARRTAVTRRILLMLLGFTAIVLVGAVVPLTLSTIGHERNSFTQDTQTMANADASIAQPRIAQRKPAAARPVDFPYRLMFVQVEQAGNGLVIYLTSGRLLDAKGQVPGRLSGRTLPPRWPAPVGPSPGRWARGRSPPFPSSMRARSPSPCWAR